METFDLVLAGFLTVLTALSVVVCTYAADMGPRTRFFGIDVDEDFRAGPEASRILLRYRASNLIVGSVTLVGMVLVFFFGLFPEMSRLAELSVAPALPTTVSFAFYLQGRRRVLALTGQPSPMGTADRRGPWKLGGLIYWDPDDPAVYVEKRFGTGHTVNMARPSAWWLLGLPLFFAGFSIAVVTLVARCSGD